MKTKIQKKTFQTFINVDEVIDKVLMGFLKRAKRMAVDLLWNIKISNKSKSTNLDQSCIKHSNHTTSAVPMVFCCWKQQHKNVQWPRTITNLLICLSEQIYLIPFEMRWKTKWISLLLFLTYNLFVSFHFDRSTKFQNL